MRKLFIIIFATAFILAGCSSGAASGQEQAANNAGSHEQHGAAQEIDEAPEGYTLSATIDEQYQVAIVTNLELSEENYNKPHQEGQGHVHLYINDQLIGPLLDMDPHPVKHFLFDGDNEIRFVLATNDHNESIYNASVELAVDYTKPAS